MISNAMNRLESAIGTSISARPGSNEPSTQSPANVSTADAAPATAANMPTCGADGSHMASAPYEQKAAAALAASWAAASETPASASAGRMIRYTIVPTAAVMSATSAAISRRVSRST